MSISVAIDVDKKAVAFSRDDETFFVGSLAELSDTIVTQLALHGLNQKGRDSYAGDRDNAEAHVKRVWEGLIEGNWTVRGEGGGPRMTQLARAVAAFLNKDEDDVAAKLADMDKEEKKAFAAHPGVAAELAKIKAADAAAKAEKAAKAAEGADIPQLSL